MTLYQRIKRILFSLCMLAVAVLFLKYHKEDWAYLAVVGILSTGLLIAAIRYMIYYFTMARHMVGGKIILIEGVIILDFALITFSLANVPRIYILLYLIGVHAFTGAVEILRAMEARRTVASHWRLKFFHGTVNIILAIACLAFIREPETALIIYSLGLMYSAVVRLFDAFRKTAFIVIN